MRTAICLIVLLMLSNPAISQKQGIQGQVFWLSGNHMPSPGKTESAPHQGAFREIHIYKALNFNTVSREGHFFKPNETAFVVKVLTSEDGQFKIRLPEGTYSVLTLEPGGLYANLMDVHGCINCVEVSPKKYSWITITIDYEAAY